MNIFKKSVIEIVGYIFFSFVIVIIAAFFFVSSCSAFSFDTFESYSVGDLSNQSSWVRSGGTFDNVVLDDTNKVAESNGTLYIPIDIISTSTISKTFTFYFKINSGTESFEMIPAKDNNQYYYFYLLFGNVSGSWNCYMKDRFGTATLLFTNISENAWHTASLTLDITNEEAYAVLDGSISTAVSNGEGLLQQLNNLRFQALTGKYIDNVYLTDFDNIPTEENNYDFTLSEVEPDFSSVQNQICFLGVECRLYFSFNQLAIGYPMYLFNYDDLNVIGNEIASTTVTATPIWQNYVIVPDQATSTELKYNFLLDAGEYGYIVVTGITINWWSEAEWQAYLDDIGPEIDEYCSAENVCENVATSSDFLYGVQCGFQQGVCWMLVPNSGSKNFFFNTVTKFESSFPFNFYFTIVNQAKSNFQKSASSDASLDFPMYSTSTGEVSWQPLISSSTVTDVWNDDTYDLTNNIFTWAWWLLVIFAITYLVYRQMI